LHVEGNHSFAAYTLTSEFAVPNELQATCPSTGRAANCTLRVNGAEIRDAVCYYPEPEVGAAAVVDSVSFWKGVQVTT